MRSYDLVVIGGGSAGLIASRTAAEFGGRVALVERARPGGDCLWTGCVPSKALLAAALTAHRTRTGARFGISGAEPRVDFTAVMEHVRRSIARLEPEDSPEALRGAGVDVISGDAVFTGPGSVDVDGSRLRFRRAVVATGSSPALPSAPGLSESDFLTSDTVWELDELPDRLVVLGGGPVGCELGQAFARLGSRVTILEAADRILPGEEPRASSVLSATLASEGIRVLTSTTVRNAAGSFGGIELSTSGPDGPGTSTADRVLAATGRVPRTSGLGLAAAGVDLDPMGYVTVDAKLRTSNRRVHAAGDVTGTLPFTHVAGIHGSIAATNAVLAPTRRFERDRIPWATFTDPEVAHVGLTEQRARQSHGAGVRVRLLENADVDRAITEDAVQGHTLVILDSAGKVLGASVVAPRAGEMIAEIAALIARGGKLRELSTVVHPYPSWTDGVWHAAVAESQAALRRPVPRRVSRALIRLRRVTG